MGDWALVGNERQETSIATASRGAANAKGSYVQLIASTSFNYKSIDVLMVSDGGGGQCYMVDIAVGAGGSEVVIVPNILFDSARGVYQNTLNIPIPLSIPAGTRLSARSQEVGGAGTRDVTVCLIGKAGGSNYGMSQNGTVTNYGAVTASTNGTLVDAGATLNTYGAWTQLTASTSRSHAGIIAVLGTNQYVSTLVDSPYYFQIGIGGAGSEIALSEFQSATSGALNRMHTNVYSLPAKIPSGTRLAMRSKCVYSGATGARQSTAIILGY